MHPTNVNQGVGYLVPHELIIEVGDDNHMLFQEGGNVSFWMNPQERVYTKPIQYDEPCLKDKTNYELIGDLKSACVEISLVKGKRVGDTHYISHKSYISVTKIISK